MRKLAALLLLPLALAAFAPQKITPEQRRHMDIITKSITSHLISQKCWTDQSHLPEARRLRAVFSVEFRVDGRFVAPPKLVEPDAEPLNDPPMAAFVSAVRQALDKCNVIGFPLPSEYFDVGSPRRIDILFLPRGY